MEFNFDLLLAGCNTRCKHCYVNGGPGPMMTTTDALMCIQKLDELASHLPGTVSFTLDNEPMNHPHLARILHAAANTSHIQNHHHGMTTGIGLMRRDDKENIIRAYREHGYTQFGLTLHGIGRHHDEIVRRSGAFETLVETARFLKEQGAQIELSLMLNRFFSVDREEISRLLGQLRPDYVFGAIPIFIPHRNMLDFEPYRANQQDIASLSGFLSRWGLDAPALLESALQNTPSAVLRRFREQGDLASRFNQPQNEMYLTIHPDCTLYYGNTGAETRCLGDLRHLDIGKTADILMHLSGNRDYGAFYHIDALSDTDTLCNALNVLPQDLVYGDFESVLYRALVHLDIPTILLYPTK